MGEQRDRMLRGELHLADGPELVADHQRYRLLIERFKATRVTDQQQGVQLLRGSKKYRTAQAGLGSWPMVS